MSERPRGFARLLGPTAEDRVDGLRLAGLGSLVQPLALLVVDGDELLDHLVHSSVRAAPDSDQYLVTAGIALLQPRREVREVTEDGLLAGPVDLQEHAEFQSASCHGAGEGDRRVRGAPAGARARGA